MVGLSIIIPMYNEQDRIEPTLRDVVTTLRAWGRGGSLAQQRPWMLRHPFHDDVISSEVLLINDGSKDNTQARAQGLLQQLLGSSPQGLGTTITGRVLTHSVNQGKGAAVRTGLAASTGAWALLMDADNATRLEQLTRFERALQPSHLLSPQRAASLSSPVAMFAASRSAPDSDIQFKWTRKLSGLIFKGALRTLGLRLAQDTQCGFKLYRSDLARYLAQHAQENGFAFDIEHFLLSRHGGWEFREVGVHWEHKDGGKISVVRDGLRMVAQARAIRNRLRDQPPPRPIAPSVLGETPPFAVEVEAKPLEPASTPSGRP